MSSFRVKVLALYGPAMPSLTDLAGTPSPGYDAVARFVANGRPRGWFVERQPEFSPPLLVVGTFYDVRAANEWAARSQAMARFRAELSAYEMPPPAQAIHAELADG